MPKLSEIQSEFQHFLVSSDPDVVHHISESDEKNARSRLDIYQHSYQAHLIQILKQAYPALTIFTSEPEFEKICHEYITKHPSEVQTLTFYGDALADFLLQHPIYRFKPYLSELAKVEWTMVKVFYASSSTCVSLENISEIQPEKWGEMKLQFHDSVYRLDLMWNVIEIWKSIIAQDQIPALENYREPRHWLFWRNQLDNQMISIQTQEAWAFDTMRRERDFAEVCEGLTRWYEENEVGTKAASLLKFWVVNNLVSDIRQL